MARQENDSFDELMELLSDSPWWVSIALGAVVFCVARFVFPAIWADPKTLSGMFAGTVSRFAWLSVIFAVPALISLVRSAKKRRMLDSQSDIETIRDLSWKQFEDLLGEAYRRKGFTVFENAGRGADGGVDLTIRQGTETYLVQCKHWKTHKVGVNVVREMLGLVTAHHVTGAIVVTSGTFTKEAASFAATQGVQLVDGDALVRLVAAVQTQPSIPAAGAPTAALTTARSCPRCGKGLILRTAKRGPNAGGQFYGCSGYPECRYTEALAG